MPGQLTRRRFALLGTIVLTGLAGCEDIGGGEGEDGGGGEEGGDGGGGGEEEEEQFQPPQNRQTAPRR